MRHRKAKSDEMRGRIYDTSKPFADTPICSISDASSATFSDAVITTVFALCFPRRRWRLSTIWKVD